MNTMGVAVLRRIFENHRACKNECSLHGELRNWLNAYGGDAKRTPRAGKLTLEDLTIAPSDETSYTHFIMDGNEGIVLARLMNAEVGEALELALEIAVDAARIRDSFKTELALGNLRDYSDEFGKRFRELDVKLRKAGYR